MNYTINWHPSANFWVGRFGQKLTAIVDHIAQGGYQSSIDWLCRANGDSSAHFIISELGDITQMVKVEDSSWSNGPLGNPDMSIPWLAECVNKGINVNTRTVSIEHAGYTGNPLPEAQYQASLWLHRKLIADNGIQIDNQHIIGHYRIDKINRPNCPGSAFPWQRLFNDLKVTSVVNGQQFDTINLLTGQPERLTINEPIFSFWQAHGGIAQLGLPVTPEVAADRFKLGFAGSVQYFERSRIEFHDADKKIYLGRVGAELVTLTK